MVSEMATTNSLCIQHATLYDGSGSAPQTADVVVAGSRVLEVTEPGRGQADTTLDAAGLALAPGFIDIHSHSDGALAHPDSAELLEPFLLQGITTQVIGNCGLGVAPAPPDRRRELAAFMALVLPQGMEFGWASFGDYLDFLEQRPAGLNVAALAESALRATNRSIEFAHDEGSGRMTITIKEEVDGEEVSRQIPPNHFLKVVERLKQINEGLFAPRGALIDTDG